MSEQMLKLKQASAVLQVEPKELQNLVQFRVVKPKRSEGMYYFDPRTLFVAKSAFYPKEGPRNVYKSALKAHGGF